MGYRKTGLSIVQCGKSCGVSHNNTTGLGRYLLVQRDGNACVKVRLLHVDPLRVLTSASHRLSTSSFGQQGGIKIR